MASVTYSQRTERATSQPWQTDERTELPIRRPHTFPFLIFCIILGVGIAFAYSAHGLSPHPASIWLVTIAAFVALVASSAIKVADQWDRAVILRLGKCRALQGPGLFFIIPIIDTVPYWVDTRVIPTAFKAEKTLTKDTVPVDVDAVLFWQVVDAQKAALNVAEYLSAIRWASQTALRDVIGKTMLADMLEGRDKISGEIQKIIDHRTEPWGIRVISVEIKDVLIPSALEDAMSKQAQAERERQARVILGDSERQIAVKFEEAAATYANNPTALHLRAMNMLYEGLKQNATFVIVPSTVLETMQLGAQPSLRMQANGKGHAASERDRQTADPLRQTASSDMTQS